MSDRRRLYWRAGGRSFVTQWHDKDLQDLQTASALLESPGFVARVFDFVGAPAELVLDALPKAARDKVTQIVRRSLQASVNTAVITLGKGGPGRPRLRSHMAAAGVAGGVGGAFGLVALPIELPITTTIILRSVADIARSEGEDLRLPEARLACLEVFAMGGSSGSDDAADSGYFAVRAALAGAVNEAARYVAKKTVIEDGAPVIVRLLAQIASRFDAVVAEKVMAQGVPVVGALGGVAVNVLFIDHFQDMARGHFIVRRLERVYGQADVRKKYEEIARKS
jgi:hypothetical protein